MLNQVELIGNLGRDPEVRALNNGGKVANVSLATTESWIDKQSGEKREKVEWHRIAVFNPAAISLLEKHVKKGDMIRVAGQLQTRSFEKDGATRYATEIVVKPYAGEVQPINLRSRATGTPEASNAGTEEPADAPAEPMLPEASEQAALPLEQERVGALPAPADDTPDNPEPSAALTQMSVAELHEYAQIEFGRDLTHLEGRDAILDAVARLERGEVID